MRELRNVEAFEADYRKFYKGDDSLLNFDAVIEEAEMKEGAVELRAYESNTGYGKTFFFDEEIVCVDEENDEYAVIATYSGHGNH